MVIELVRQYYYGGVIIDTRVQPILITNDIRIPAGTVIVINKDGSQVAFKENNVSAEFVKRRVFHTGLLPPPRAERPIR